MIEVLIDILLALVALLGIILLAPFHFDFGGEYEQRLSFRGQVRWAGGLFSLEIMRRVGKMQMTLGFFGLKKPISNMGKKEPKKKKPNRKKGLTDSIGNLSSFITRQLFTAVKVVFSKLVQALHLGLNLSGIYGFDDPSLTGVMAGVIAALNIGRSSEYLNPDFTGAVAEIQGSMRGWFIPLQILVIVLLFLLKKPVRAIWLPKRKFNKKQKEDVQYA